jgi:hypothetical protein
VVQQPAQLARSQAHFPLASQVCPVAQAVHVTPWMPQAAAVGEMQAPF